MRNFSPLGLAALLCVALVGRPAAAQQPVTVTGRVTIESGAPLAGASVSITDLGIGDYTNSEGQYTIRVPAARAQGQQVTLQVRRLGYKAATATVTLSGATVTQDFALAAAATQLEAVVSTALGIEKSKRTLTVAQQQVDSSALTRTPAPNLVSTLSGKVAGIAVTSATTPGGSARIVIRGANSIAGNNQPLFVVDGVPVDNSNYNSTTTDRGYGGYDYGNAAQDINPDDIASISVLKGPNAAALYGARAANGAIIITTKTGKGAKGFQVSASTNVTFDTPLRLPDYQNQWGQGFGGAYCQPTDPGYDTCGFSYVDGNYNGVNDGVDESWGPRLDGTPRSQFSFTTPGEAEVRPWVAHPNNVKSFFQTGHNVMTNVAAQGSNDRANFRLSLTNEDITGMVPNNALKRVTASLNAGAQVNSRLSTSGSIQYIRNTGQNRPGTGYDESNPMMGFVWFGRQVDIAGLGKHYSTPDGQQISWNYSYHNNPFWNQYMNTNRDERNRVIGVAQANYKFTDWLNGQLRTGTDFYRDFRAYDINAGWIGGLFDGGDYSQGGFQENTRFNQETNTDFLLTATHQLLGNLGLTANFGGNARRTAFRRNAFGTDQLVVPGTYNIGNSAKPVVPVEYTEQKATNSLYGQTEFNYHDYFIVNLTGRNDWSSTLPKGNNSYFYPSVGASFVFTDALPSLSFGGLLGYGKLRASWSRVGNDADPYQLYPTYVANTPFGSVPRFGVPNDLLNSDLKPENTDAWEVGTEMQWLDGRLGADVTYYQKRTSNQILRADISRASGFATRMINAGVISNKGVEAQLNLTPLRMDNGFTWDMTVNYGQNRSRVEELAPGLQTVLLVGSHWLATIEARLDEPYGAIYGTTFARDDQGRILTRDGLPVASSQKSVLGHYPPDWTGGVVNSFKYHSFNLAVTVDGQKGGSVYSTGNMWGTYAGVLAQSLPGRDKALLVNGIDKDTGLPNQIYVTAEDYNHSLWRIQERWVYDASFMKLREISLGWDVPSSLLGRFNVSQARASLIGRNLALWAKAPNIDPETTFGTSNLQGLEMGQLPTARSIGFQLSVTP